MASAARRTSLPVTAGQVSAGGEAAATQRDRWGGGRWWWGGEDEGERRARERAAQPKGAHLQQTKDQFSPFHSQLLITSKSSTGPAAVSPLKCAVHTCGYTHIPGSCSRLKPPPLSLKSCTNRFVYPIVLMKAGKTTQRSGRVWNFRVVFPKIWIIVWVI